MGNESQLPQCLTIGDFHCMERHLRANVTKSMLDEQVTGCKRPCINMQLFYDKRIYMQLKPLVNMSSIAIYHENTDTLVTEEVLLYDLNSIVSAVGGSLGLFLGFSCYQGAMWIAGIISMHTAYLLQLRLRRKHQTEEGNSVSIKEIH